MKRARDNKDMGEEIKLFREWGNHMKENKGIQLSIIPKMFFYKIMFL